MQNGKHITIVGGGLAGLTLGIGLRLREVPVTILEAGSYPRHRVCGEFVSGRGQDVLARQGLRDIFLRAGSLMGRTAAFFLGNARSPARTLTPPAWCLSRFEMDGLLAERFRNCGGELRQNSRWRGTSPGEGIVFASGRRVQPLEDGWRWLGLKVHVRAVKLEADLEMHSLPNGYVGLCQLPAGRVNVCGLFRQSAQQHPALRPWQQLLRGPSGTALRTRLEGAAFEPGSFCSVAGLALKPHRAGEQKGLCIGDALTMIPPVTGNGMSMAFEAAELAVEPLAAYSAGSVCWQEALDNVACACDTAFARRLAWSQWLQWLMFAPAFKGVLGKCLLHSRGLWRLMFAMTR